MTETQDIFFNHRLNFNLHADEPGIVKKTTEVLNLYLEDSSDSNSLCLIGDRLEWKPSIWMSFEEEKISKLKEINVISLRGDASLVASYCKNKFPDVKINYYGFPLYLTIHRIKDTLKNTKYIPTGLPRSKNIFSSFGSLRLNRYIFIKESQKQDYDNVFYPAITESTSKSFEYEISKCAERPIHDSMQLAENRIFDTDMTYFQFIPKAMRFIAQAYVNIVATFPNTNMIQDGDDEKYFDTILAKSIPFMLCEKDSNVTGVSLLGFQPYRGFDLTNDADENHVRRWESLLQDNRDIFSNAEKCQELYDMNREIVKANFDRLCNTDWDNEHLSQYKQLPTLAKEYLNIA